jgi:FlaA1/EpsC-like NDP-sugar epimerase
MNSKNNILIFLDALASFSALYLSFLIRLDFDISDKFFNIFLFWSAPFITIHIIIFLFSDLYARIWRYTSLFDLYAIIKSVFLSFLFSVVFVFMATGLNGYPRSVLLLYLIFNLIFTVAIRLSVRVYFTHYHKDSPLRNNYGNVKKTLLLIGAGKTGEKITREIMTTMRDQYSIIGFVDDDIRKQGALIHGKQVFGSISSLLDLKIIYDEILITMPTATGDQIRRVVDICKNTGKRYKTVPAMNEIMSGEISMAVVRDVSYSDLLGREEVKLDMNSIEKLIQQKRILITGAGGSIGSELVRQCLAFKPSEIICLDSNEENIYKLDQYCIKKQTKTIMKTVLASINKANECEKVFSENRPHIVLHAAAYKHVPIQEMHPWTAVETNIGGTLNIVKLSDKYSVDKFVLVSTDKAVNPTNVMGASKRVSEKLIKSYNQISDTKFMAVRFGNVLGSSGSAIPTFQRQINEGGPITITHPEMTRYFMSIQEASQLILQCSSLGNDGEIFLLEMGKPIRIIQMAKDLIRLSGLEPDIDIAIVYTGLRPGEKLYEELQFLDEIKVRTPHKKITILKDKSSHIPWHILELKINELLISSDNLESQTIILLLKELLPSYSSKILNSTKNNEDLSKTSIKAEA